MRKDDLLLKIEKKVVNYLDFRKKIDVNKFVIE